MPDRLTRLLAERPWLLTDGATGTNYFNMGLETGDPPELWNVEHPERVTDLHDRFIAAGADIILTNSFGGTRYRLKLHKAEDRVAELNIAAAQIARASADAAGREVVVAASIGPTGELLVPLGALTMDDAVEAFAEQAIALAKGGADVIWIETMSSVDELTAAVTGAGRSGLPIAVTLSFDTNGRTMMGVTPAQVAELVSKLEPKPIAYGGNCGTGASELMAVLVNMREAAGTGDILIAKSNCGIPEFVEGAIHYTGTPELMADYARMAMDAGIRIIGGCCGTTPMHLQAMHEALVGHEPGETPTMDEIVTRLGPISKGAEMPSALGAQPDGETAGRRRGRRRAKPDRDTTPRF